MSTAILPADAESKSCGSISFRIVYHAAWRHPLAFLGLLLLAAAPGVWFFFPPPRNSAAVVFHISSQSQTLLPSLENRGDFTV
jgi:hypothetical protein